jgi:hypothetical protein
MSIHIKPSHKGLLHEKLGVAQGKHIPASKIERAEHSSSPALRKEAQFAENASHWHHGHSSMVHRDDISTHTHTMPTKRH